MQRERVRWGRRAVLVSLVSSAAFAALAGCSALTALDPAPTPRDAEGRAIDPGPASPSVCATRPPPFPSSSCTPVHNPPSRLYVEQAINTLLPTRGYTSVEHPRCTERTVEPPSDSDPAGLDAWSHWACVGAEIRGRWLHEDVIWSPSTGSLTLNAVTRDLSPELTLPQPNDPGLPNPYLPDESQQPTPSRTPSQHELAAH